MPVVNTLIGALLIAVNAFFAMAEYALVRIRPSRVEELTRKGRRLAPLVRFATDHLNEYLSAVQFAITMTSLGLGWVGEPGVAALIARILPKLPFALSVTFSASLSFAAAFALITLFHITFGELLPKILAIRNPERAVIITIVPLTVMYYAAYVPMLLSNKTASAIARALAPRRTKAEETHSEDEIKILLEQREEAGTLSLQRLIMFENLFDFGSATVREVMTPRGSIAYLSSSRSWEDNLATMRQRRMSRYPVARDDLDSIVGYVHIKDLAFDWMGGDPAHDLLTKARPILRFRESLPLEQCLHLMQDRRTSMAVVVDSKRKVSGLLTMEDIVEEIVGEIRDEFERKPGYRLTEVIVPDASDFDCRDQDLFTLLRDSVDRLHAVRPTFDPEVALDQVLRRERGLSSALGHGAAFPHARIDGLDRPLVSFTRCPDGLDLKSIDGKPVGLVFLILTPFNEPTAQLGLLSNLARLVLNPTLNDRLSEATNKEELVEVLHTFEDTVPI